MPYIHLITFTVDKDGGVSESSTLFVTDLGRVVEEVLNHVRNSGKVADKDELLSGLKVPLADGRFELKLNFGHLIAVAILPSDPAQGPSS